MEAIDESFQGVNIKFFNRLYVGLLDWIGSPRSRKWTGSKSSRNAHTFKDLVGKSREQIEDTIEAECAILQDKLRKNHSSPWRFIREICGMRKTVFNYGAGQSNRKRLAAVKDFFSKIANRGVGDTKVEFDEAKNFEGEIMDLPFTEDELACAARRLKRSKAPGLDEIPAKAYISILEENSLRHLLLGIINKTLETGPLRIRD